MSLKSEVKRANDAINSSLRMMGNLDEKQNKALVVIMRMCYYKGMLEYTNARDKIHDLFMKDDDDE